MADVVSPQVRSRMMAGIRGRNTRPELVVRTYLHRAGFRFRVAPAVLPGRPDLALRKWRVVVLVHGCFWHGHEGCRYFKIPATRPEFWRAKIGATIERDRNVRALLLAQGWRVATVWECALRTCPEKTLKDLAAFLTSGDRVAEFSSFT